MNVRLLPVGCCAAVAAFFGAFVSSSLHAQVTFTELAGMSMPWGVSDDGTVVAGADLSSHNGVHWSPSTGSVHFSDTKQIIPSAVSADGKVIAGYEFTSSHTLDPLRWTAADGIIKMN